MHPTIDVCLALKNQAGFKLNEIEKVDVVASSLALLRANRLQPVDAMECKLSLQHAAAVALLYGKAGLQQFSDAATLSIDINSFRQRICLSADDLIDAGTAEVTLALKGGQRLTQRISQPLGCEANPLTKLHLINKFTELVNYGSCHHDAEKLHALLETFEITDDAGAIVMKTVPGLHF